MHCNISAGPTARLLAAADQWDEYAQEKREMAAWNRKVSIDASTPGQSAGDYAARQADRAAETLRAEAYTGHAHCMCCMVPTKECPYSGSERNAT